MAAIVNTSLDINLSVGPLDEMPAGDTQRPAGATADLAERLSRLAADPDLRDWLGAAGRARVVPRYAVDRLVDDIDRLYRSLLLAAAIRPPAR